MSGVNTEALRASLNGSMELVRFGRDSGTESDGPVTAAHAPTGARGSPVETALNGCCPGVPKKLREGAHK
ncbi:hypothetical protein ON010_g19149 [Phytophthora cinnamomi]|nr:hypothetical protein ON010_g19149 [Phytophthora cinnamomi]